MMAALLQITAPHFCAGIIVDKGKVIDAAPILKRNIGKQWSEVQDYFNRQNYKIVIVAEDINHHKMLP